MKKENRGRKKKHKNPVAKGFIMDETMLVDLDERRETLKMSFSEYIISLITRDLNNEGE